MGFGGGATMVAGGGAGVLAGGAGGSVVGGAGGSVVGGAGGLVVGEADGLADGGMVVGDADGLAECAVAVGLGVEEWAATAVLQPAVNAASSASPAADRAREKDMDQPFRSWPRERRASCVHIAVTRTLVIRSATLPGSATFMAPGVGSVTVPAGALSLPFKTPRPSTSPRPGRKTGQRHAMAPSTTS
jgi:hypothetical protein